jgi:hypothetical protein
MAMAGKCRCGAIRYALDAEPATARPCWCRDCQYWARGNAALNAIAPRAAPRVEGEPRFWESLADSGNRMRRWFCGACGTQPFGGSEGNAERIAIRVGTLDDAGGRRPLATIRTDSAPAWAVVDPGIPSFPRQPA